MVLWTSAIAIVTALIASFFVRAVRTRVAARSTMTGRLANWGGNVRRERAQSGGVFVERIGDTARRLVIAQIDRLFGGLRDALNIATRAAEGRRRRRMGAAARTAGAARAA